MWAEDGPDFLGVAYRHGLGALLTPHGRYLQFAPRLASAFTAWLPVRWQGGVICASAALVHAGAAATAAATVWDRASVGIGVLVAGFVLALPTAPEAWVNWANVQWFLLFICCLLPLARPTGQVRWTILTVVVVVGILSSPFGPLCACVAGFVWWRRRTLASAWLAGCSGAAALVQIVAMMVAPARTIRTEPSFRPVALARRYFWRIAVDGVSGIGHYDAAQPNTSWLLGSLCAISTVGMLAFAVRLPRPKRRLAVFCGVLSIVSFLLPTVLSGLYPVDPFSESRYYVTSVLFLLTGLGIVVGSVFETISRGAVARWRVRRCAWAMCACLAIGLVVYGATTSWRAAATARHGIPGWYEQTSTPSCPHRVLIAPAGWAVTVPCR